MKSQSKFVLYLNSHSSNSLNAVYILLRSPELYKLDHQYPGKMAKNRPVVILYGEIGSKKLTEFHNTLKPLSVSGEIIYVMRHYISDRKGTKVRLSGNYLINSFVITD